MTNDILKGFFQGDIEKSKNLQLGLPYMGSKRKLSSKIVDHILINNPECEYVYDLFGGGGAISFEFAQRKQIKKVVYNEIDYDNFRNEIVWCYRSAGFSKKNIVINMIISFFIQKIKIILLI